jgi:hypothetical protein
MHWGTAIAMRSLPRNTHKSHTTHAQTYANAIATKHAFRMWLTYYAVLCWQPSTTTATTVQLAPQGPNTLRHSAKTTLATSCTSEMPRH